MNATLGAVRIACVGDSITRGTFVWHRKANAYPAQLQAMLGDRFCVRNFGVNAYGTFQELLLLHRLLTNGPSLHQVFVMFYQNDFYNNLDDDPWQGIASLRQELPDTGTPKKDRLQNQGASFDKLRMRDFLGAMKIGPHPELVEGRTLVVPAEMDSRHGS